MAVIASGVLWEAVVSSVIVEVMPKSGVSDPQSRAISGVLPKVGYGEFDGVRVGKRFELAVEGPVTGDVLARARALAEELLANPVVEDVVAVFAGEEE